MLIHIDKGGPRGYENSFTIISKQVKVEILLYEILTENKVFKWFLLDAHRFIQIRPLIYPLNIDKCGNYLLENTVINHIRHNDIHDAKQIPNKTDDMCAINRMIISHPGWW